MFSTLTSIILSALCLTSYAQFDTTVDFSKLGGWQAEPGWLPNPAERPVSQARGASAEFQVNEPRTGMKWRLVRVPDHLMASGYLVVRYRAVDVALSSDYLFWVFDAKPGGHSLAPLSLLKNDGQWHTLSIDLEQTDASGHVTGLAVHVQAGDKAPASLRIESLSFREDPPAETDLYPQPPVQEVSIVESFDKASEWQPHTSWLDNPEEAATIVDDEGAALMTVSSAGKGMKWSKRFEQPLDLSEARYVALRYRAENLAPSGDYFVWIGSEAGGRPQEYETLLPLHQVEDDGRWHVYVAPLKKQFRIAEMAIQTQAEVSPGKAWIDYVKFTSRKPLIPMADYLACSKGSARWGKSTWGG
ncbi:MAG: hypothetical protein HY318_19515 [Armatimonadetes bacterium]|nr:hypothetical protein [Armatimonadota bacterium]